mmetsp:Transcript_38133/g.94571  ORF Transcript_38133/g.94571 Transcript_38133/m.94571 type:complete len:242 (-) Transcript_38133:1065-1790(-)
MRRNTASSKSNGRLVAANTTSCSVSRVRSPSQCSMNSFFISRTAGCSSDFPREANIASTSSMNSTHGESLPARLKSAFTYLLLSPSHFDITEDIVTCIKFAHASEATAFANIVFPVPGGPNSKTPFVGVVRFPRQNNSGRERGRETTSRRAAFASSSVAISSQQTPSSPAGTTHESNESSKRFTLTPRTGVLFAVRESRAQCKPAAKWRGSRTNVRSRGTSLRSLELELAGTRVWHALPTS